MNGWTTVRSAGESDVGFAHFDVRRMIESGFEDLIRS